MLKPFMALMCAAPFVAGCATMVEGTGQSVAVATAPPGASCSIDRMGERLGMVAPTPGSVRLDKSKNDLTVTCSKDGFQTTKVTHSPKFVGTIFGNLLLGGAVGFIVDAASGANYSYPADVSIALAPATPALPPLAAVGAGAVVAVPSSGMVPASGIMPVAATVPNRM